MIGGTIDITAHEMLDDEIIKANGGNWGGTKMDEEYMDFINYVSLVKIRQSTLMKTCLVYFLKLAETLKLRSIQLNQIPTLNLMFPLKSEKYTQHCILVKS